MKQHHWVNADALTNQCWSITTGQTQQTSQVQAALNRPTLEKCVVQYLLDRRYTSRIIHTF